MSLGRKVNNVHDIHLQITKRLLFDYRILWPGHSGVKYFETKDNIKKVLNIWEWEERLILGSLNKYRLENHVIFCLGWARLFSLRFSFVFVSQPIYSSNTSQGREWENKVMKTLYMKKSFLMLFSWMHGNNDNIFVFKLQLGRLNRYTFGTWR